MITTTRPSLIARWRRQFGRRSRRFSLPRPLAGLGYLVNRAVFEDLIEVENLVLVALFDEEKPDGQTVVSLAGFSGRRVPWGVQWGGQENSLFLKDLLSRPSAGARGCRLDANRVKLLELALCLDRKVDRYSRYRQLAAQRQPTLPSLWAGFRRSAAGQTTADGPELLAAAQRKATRPEDLLRQSTRHYEGLVLFPLDWVSHDWPQMAAVFADMGHFPECQVFAVDNPKEDLHGFHGAAEFDFLNNRYRRGPGAVPGAATVDAV